ncbi:MAG: hypothetical protein ACOCVM_00140 [Desulfovibrionaceae bacterium]
MRRNIAVAALLAAWALTFACPGNSFGELRCEVVFGLVPTPFSANAMWGALDGQVFIAGDSGEVLRYDGRSWSKTSLDGQPDIYSIYGAASDNVYAVGPKGTILHYDGSAWSRQDSPANDSLYGVWGVGNTFYAVGNYRTVLKNDGRGWDMLYETPKMQSLPGVMGLLDNPGAVAVGDFSFFSIWGPSENDFYIGGYNDRLFHCADDVVNSTKLLGCCSQFKLWGTSDNNIFAAGVGSSCSGCDQAVILRYDGAAWARDDSAPGHQLADIHGSSYDNVFAVGRKGNVLRFDGRQWTPAPPKTLLFGDNPKDLYFTGVWAFSSDNVFAVTDSGDVLHYDGQEWTVQCAEDTEDRLDFIAASSPDRIFAANSNGDVIRCNGKSWDIIKQSYPGFSDLVLYSEDSLLALTRYYGIMRFEDSAWTNETIPKELGDRRCIWTPDGSDIFIGGREGVMDGAGAVMRRTNGTWSRMDIPTREIVWDIGGTASDNVFAVGGQDAGYSDSGFALRFDGEKWTRLSPPVSGAIAKVCGVFGNEAYFSSITRKPGAKDFYQLLKYDGVAWEVMLEGDQTYVPAVWKDDRGDLYAAGDCRNRTGRLMRHDGRAWSDVPAPPTRGFTAIAGDGAGRIFATTRDGRVLKISR